MRYVKDYWLAAVYVVGTFLFYTEAVGTPWWAAAITTVVTWGLAGVLCMLGTGAWR